jgi:hypothetical protein
MGLTPPGLRRARMTTDPLPRAADCEHLTGALRRCGALGAGRVCNVVVESSRATILSRIIRLRLSYEGAAADEPSSLILKTGLPERADAKWNSGRHEVAFYTRLPPGWHVPPALFRGVWNADTRGALLPRRPRGRFIATAASADDGDCKRITQVRHAHVGRPRLGVSIGTWLPADDGQLRHFAAGSRACRSKFVTPAARAPALRH